MGRTTTSHPCSSTSWRSTRRPPTTTHERPSREGVLREAGGTVLLALHLDHWAPGEKEKIPETELPWDSLLNSSLLCPLVGNLPLRHVQELPEEDRHGWTPQSGLRFWRGRWEWRWEEWEEKSQGPRVRHHGGQVLQIWDQSWVDDDPPHHQPQVPNFELKFLGTGATVEQTLTVCVVLSVWTRRGRTTTWSSGETWPMTSAPGRGTTWTSLTLLFTEPTTGGTGGTDLELY